MTTCPVCRKGETEGADRDGWPNTVSHLACVQQSDKTMRVAVEANGRLKAENEESLAALFDAQKAITSAEKVVLAQRAELAALKCEVKMFRDDVYVADVELGVLKEALTIIYRLWLQTRYEEMEEYLEPFSLDFKQVVREVGEP